MKERCGAAELPAGVGRPAMPANGQLLPAPGSVTASAATAPPLPPPPAPSAASAACCQRSGQKRSGWLKLRLLVCSATMDSHSTVFWGTLTPLRSSRSVPAWRMGPTLPTGCMRSASLHTTSR